MQLGGAYVHPCPLLYTAQAQHRRKQIVSGTSKHLSQFQNSFLDCSLTPVACLHSWQRWAQLCFGRQLQTEQRGQQHYWDTRITHTPPMPQASSYLVHRKAASKLDQCPPSHSFPWSSAALCCAAWGCGSCGAALASLPSTAPKLLADCRQHNVSGVLSPNAKDCLVKQNKKEVFLYRSLIS